MPSRSARTTGSRRSGRAAQPVWASYDDERLLDLRFCDLRIEPAQTRMSDYMERLYDELARRGIRHRPHMWFSSEWFSPDGVPGIALPFYLGHERLMRLEKKKMLEVEGGADRACMRILRHEAGHAICTAYRLHYRASWRKHFGRFSKPYPDSYRPNPNSRHHVVHLNRWYAQAHPAEDFAETFAVWLRPGSRWRQSYRGWPALRKLEFVEELMRDLAGATPPVRTRRRIEPISELRTTLREHYKAKRLRYGSDWPDVLDRDLYRIFSNDKRYASNPSAASFLRREQRTIREHVSRWTGTYQYTIDQVLRDTIDRCRELKLRLAIDEDEARMQATLMITVQTMNYIHGGHHRILL
ncbi:MAG: hypothetical protein EA377_08250 [Phycisphaerales bacterium]|nr:MAG: hypothetical protein EA377_08250 [Phycisphaerales bacterium]